MISFFRKIRQALLDQNRVTRYLAYAIGEIALVMIGILLALQVNTWNEERKLRKEEAQLIQNLHEEFQRNLIKLDSISSKLSRTEKSLGLVLDLIDQKEGPIREEMLDSLLIKSVIVAGKVSQSFVLEDMKNTGGLSKISSTELKILLFEWERNFVELQSSLELGRQAFEEYANHIIQKGSIRNIDAENSPPEVSRSKLPISNIPLLQDPVFENHVDNCQVLSNEHLFKLSQTRKLMVSILDLTSK
ncbi:hypothetical protein DFQ04_1674 [Algoriphagus boseongensis]|uniref:Uncharacterized protein n=1 Tax=Algoriphagus boseongensis TaxID=1442587 RepID=A0A4R6T652_9BACT|nr:DUF6090 family protein [Algoriphagus boseongensis]TDQ17026.1 hypothetical protein DFQ04_1674 [Algoriphagus boseongensis]